MDYCFTDKVDIKLIVLFITENFRMPVPDSYIVDILTLQPFVNYFDLQNCIGEMREEGFIAYTGAEDEIKRCYPTEKGSQALSFFSARIPKTVRERLLRTINVKVKELKNELSLKSSYKKVNDLEYMVNLGITEGISDLFNLSLSVGDEAMAKKMCAAFRENPQALYSQLLSVLIQP